MRKIILLAFTVAGGIVLKAQEQTTPRFEDSVKVKELDAAVVTGQYKPQSVRNSVYQVKVIGQERLQKQAATKLQDVLNNELNIRISQDVSTGSSNITMLGLSGQNVKILLDGLPLIGRSGTTNEISLDQIDINSVERIEIVEGPMSVIYGADALGGVINIITKKNKQAKFSVSARVQEETVGNEYGWKEGIHNQYVSLSWKQHGWEAGGSFGHNYFGGWKDTAVDRELVWHWKDQLIANGFLGYSNARFNIRYRIDGMDELITNPGNFSAYRQDAGDSVARDQEYLSRRVMQQLQSSYVVNKDLSFQAQASYTDYQRQVFTTLLSQNTGKLSMDAGNQAIIRFNGFTFRGTALYKLSSLVSFQPGVDLNYESGKGERLKAGSNEITDYAFFLTSEITPSSRINIRPGIRVIHNSVYDAPPVIPSVNAKVGLTKNIDFRVAYARGFRAPSLRELYFNFLDANHTIVGDEDLKAETSNSFTGSFTWRNLETKDQTATISLGGFYNKVSNLISYLFVQGNDTAFLANVSKSKTAGASLTATWKKGNWDLAAGVSNTGFYNDFAEQDAALPEMKWSAEANARIGYSFPHTGLDANLFYKFTGKQPYYVQQTNAVVLAEQEGFHMADITVNKKFNKTILKYFTLQAGVRNLFDVTRISSRIAATGSIHGAGGTRNLAYGRSYFAGLAFNWAKK